MTKHKSATKNPPKVIEEAVDEAPAVAAPPQVAKPLFRPGTKQALVHDLLTREEGASLEELVSATGWLSHTTRAALTGMRKRGHAVEKTKTDGVTRYRIAAAA